MFDRKPRRAQPVSNSADAFVVEEPTFSPVQEPVYAADGTLAALGSREFFTSTTGHLPDSEIPVRTPHGFKGHQTSSETVGTLSGTGREPAPDHSSLQSSPGEPMPLEKDLQDPLSIFLGWRLKRAPCRTNPVPAALRQSTVDTHAGDADRGVGGTERNRHGSTCSRTRRSARRVIASVKIQRIQWTPRVCTHARCSRPRVHLAGTLFHPVKPGSELTPLAPSCRDNFPRCSPRVVRVSSRVDDGAGACAVTLTLVAGGRWSSWRACSR
jgi:hypothetical protein